MTRWRAVILAAVCGLVGIAYLVTSGIVMKRTFGGTRIEGEALISHGLPVFSNLFETLQTSGAVRYVGFHTYRSHNVLISGTASDYALRVFCTNASLSYYPRWPIEDGLAKVAADLQSPTGLIETQFGPNDSYADGYSSAFGRMTVRHRRSDGRFTAHVSK